MTDERRVISTFLMIAAVMLLGLSSTSGGGESFLYVMAALASWGAAAMIGVGQGG